MKKLAFIGTAITTLLTPVQVLAQKEGQVVISPPANVGFRSLSDFIEKALLLVFTVGAFIVLLMLIIGAYEWMTSGGDKEAVGKARNRIINALIGLVVLAVAFALVRIIGIFTGLELTNLRIIGPNPTDTRL
jgi:hypothetical protein